jgi:hypothetical protein
MWFHSLMAPWKSERPPSRGSQSRPARRRTRPIPEQLEDRRLLSNYSAATVSDLIADIQAANTAGGANTISLTAPTTSPYVLTAMNNGDNGLPVIVADDNLTIVGNGDTIERSTASGTPVFRLLDVASGGSLTLGNLTLQDGEVQAVGPLGGGGAIYSQGTLVLNGVTLQDNIAVGPMGEYNAHGGGILSSGGSVTLEGGTVVQNNEALAGSVGAAGRVAGDAYGGGLYAGSGVTVIVTNATLDNNVAVGGEGETSGTERSENGYGCGGGLYAGPGATVTLTNATLVGNVARYATNVCAGIQCGR